MKQYCIVYRTGGTGRFEWRRTLPIQTWNEALDVMTSLKRMGYHTLLPEDYDMSVNIGLPETWLAHHTDRSKA